MCRCRMKNFSRRASDRTNLYDLEDGKAKLENDGKCARSLTTRPLGEGGTCRWTPSELRRWMCHKAQPLRREPR